MVVASGSKGFGGAWAVPATWEKATGCGKLIDRFFTNEGRRACVKSKSKRLVSVQHL